MKINFLSLFPETFKSLEYGVIKKALDKGVLEFTYIDIRKYSLDKHFKCDDAPYGGGAGMVMTAQPIVDCINAIDPTHSTLRIFMSPRGEQLNQQLVCDLSKIKEITLLCGCYEGVDQRAIDLCIDKEISIGDYILTGGELPAMVLANCLSRYVDGVLGNSETVLDESFSNLLLEYPHYTRPETYNNLSAPSVLLGGNHKEINLWRDTQKLHITKELRPDLYEKYIELNPPIPEKKKRSRSKPKEYI